ncbi:type IV pilus biogenesis protein PilM [Paraburkholderia sediminicola]|uniref:type IV pilus biogenesis protein PilM n=1 Tax=Paraburkholderia sediminicola TaxID=458836 RepID=UPI0038B7694E
MAFLVFVICAATLVYETDTLQAVQPAAQTVSVQAAAAQFLSYRSAAMAYMTANPTFTGTIQSSQLTAYSPQYSPVFISNYAASNAVTVSGTGRMITVYAALPTGSVQQVLVQSGNDASIGLSAGTTWTTDANGVTTSPQPLNVAVPAGDVVSVVKTGN